MLINNDEGIYSMALALLYVLKDNNRFCDISKLSLILDKDNFDKLIDYYGGLTIYIPTRDEVNCALKSLIFYQEYYINGKQTPEARKLSGASIDEIVKVQSYAKSINRYFNKLSEKNFDKN